MRSSFLSLFLSFFLSFLSFLFLSFSFATCLSKRQNERESKMKSRSQRNRRKRKKHLQSIFKKQIATILFIFLKGRLFLIFYFLSDLLSSFRPSFLSFFFLSSFFPLSFEPAAERESFRSSPP